jgi:hypothetical protein
MDVEEGEIETSFRKLPSSLPSSPHGNVILTVSPGGNTLIDAYMDGKGLIVYLVSDKSWCVRVAFHNLSEYF